LNGDASTDIRAVPDYKRTISRLLQAGKFEQLDCLADSTRSNKEVFPGGTWKLHTIYVGLEEPLLHATPKDWKAHIGLLKKWVAARPQSITARVAFAEACVNYAWDARGHGYADSVSQNGWKLFEQRSAEGRKSLQAGIVSPGQVPGVVRRDARRGLGTGLGSRRQASFA